MFAFIVVVSGIMQKNKTPGHQLIMRDLFKLYIGMACINMRKWDLWVRT